MSQPEIIQIKHLTVEYDNNIILDNIDLSVRQGEIFVILGGSGCGKTTLLYQIIGLQQPKQGEIWIDGKNMVGASEQEKTDILKDIGVAYQSGALFGSMTLLENVCLPLEEFTQLPLAVIQTIALHKLSLVGLEAYAGYLPAEVSGGMAKRAAIARAMALNPKILFLDEPSAGLDPVTSSQLDQLILQLSQSLGVTFVIVSHELPSIMTIAQRCIMLYGKKIIAEGNPVTLKEHCDNVFVKQFFNRRPNPEGSA